MRILRSPAITQMARSIPPLAAEAKCGPIFRVLQRSPSSLVIQPDGKIVVAGGAFPLFTFAGNFVIVRYNANGSLDRSFGENGIVTTFFDAGSYASAVALQPDGKIIAAGTDFVDFVIGDQSDTDFALARYNRNGSLDTTFGNRRPRLNRFLGKEDDAFSVLIQPDGKIVAVGSANDPVSSTISPLRDISVMVRSIRHLATAAR